MNYWLFKTEPDDISLADIQAAGPAGLRWDGIRNYQARNCLRDGVSVGDGVLIYHASCKPAGIVGRAEVIRAAYADPAQFDPLSHYFDPRAGAGAPRWYCVDIAFREAFARPCWLAEIKADSALADMALVRQGRLSVQPVRASEWAHLLKRCGAAV